MISVNLLLTKVITYQFMQGKFAYKRPFKNGELKFLVWIFYSFISFFSDTQRLQLIKTKQNKIFTYVHESNHENTALPSPTDPVPAH